MKSEHFEKESKFWQGTLPQYRTRFCVLKPLSYHWQVRMLPNNVLVSQLGFSLLKYASTDVAFG